MKACQNTEISTKVGKTRKSRLFTDFVTKKCPRQILHKREKHAKTRKSVSDIFFEWVQPVADALNTKIIKPLYIYKGKYKGGARPPEGGYPPRLVEFWDSVPGIAFLGPGGVPDRFWTPF